MRSTPGLDPFLSVTNDRFLAANLGYFSNLRAMRLALRSILTR